MVQCSWSSGRLWKQTNLAAASILGVWIAQSSAQCEVDFAILAVMVSLPYCATASVAGSTKI
jgi:hypothetical protein